MMMAAPEQVPLSEDLLGTLRVAARWSLELREPFVTPRALLLALLEHPQAGVVLAGALNRERLRAARPDETLDATRTADASVDGEPVALARYDTLAFKTPDGRTSMWLSRAAYRIFVEGAKRAGDGYSVKHLAAGMAGQAAASPAWLAAIPADSGALIHALYNA